MICRNYHRGQRLREIRRWRKFRDHVQAARDEQLLKQLVLSMEDEVTVLVTHGWMAEAIIVTKYGRHYGEKTLSLPALREAALNLYAAWRKQLKPCSTASKTS